MLYCLCFEHLYVWTILYFWKIESSSPHDHLKITIYLDLFIVDEATERLEQAQISPLLIGRWMFK